MKLTREGIELIKEYEGFRSKAYKCPAGVLTIFYGHTSAAGLPIVKEGMSGTKAEGAKVLRDDLRKYEAYVREAINVELTPNQFSACVSLAYNIGGGAFKKSSVARFCNQRRWKDAADAFALWNKANGKVLPGLVRRRAAEAALFSSHDVTEDEEVRPVVDEPKGKPLMASTTNVAAGVTAAAGVSAAAKDIVENTSSIFSAHNIVILLLILVIVAGAAWIIKERWQKSVDWGI